MTVQPVATKETEMEDPNKIDAPQIGGPALTSDMLSGSMGTITGQQISAGTVDGAYNAFVESKKKDGLAIAAALTRGQADALHMAVGVAGEGGELLDAIKRWAIYQKPLDRANVIEELGDLEFFMQGLRSRLGITRQETLDANMAKLDVRYKEGYTDAEAAARNDKAAHIPAGMEVAMDGNRLTLDQMFDDGLTASPAECFYRREIGENGWQECTPEQYEQAKLDPNMDTAFKRHGEPHPE